MDDLATTVRRIFSSGGQLSGRPGFEYRAQQETMAVEVAAALEQQAHLLIEAPTGVGKTLAYLIPSLVYSISGHRKAVVSTHTKNLQEQLFHNDLPIARSLLGGESSVVVLKGRKNYLCPTRLRAAVSAPDSFFDREARDQLSAIGAWSHMTRDGDVEGLGFIPRPDVWESVCSEQGMCSPTICGPGCFFQKVRERVRAANLVIINHALFFRLLAMQDADDRYIFENDFVILDEAHTIEAVAGAGSGSRLSQRQVLLSLHRLFNPQSKKGILASRSNRVVGLCRGTEKTATEFFASVRQAAGNVDAGAAIRAPGNSREVRIRSPHLLSNTLDEPLRELQLIVKRAEDEQEDQLQKQEFAAARRSLSEIQSAIDGFLEQREPEFTYWVEISAGRTGQVALCSSPVDIAETIGPKLFRDSSSVVMTSATLSVGSSLDYFRSRIGAPPVRTLILDSPFDHRRQMRLCLVRDIPEPDSDGYPEHLARWILTCVDRSGGKALVLFTSAALMRTLAATLAEALEERGLTLLVQGSGKERSALLEEFKRDIRSVLFGLESFWAGVDVPGEALEQVIITRLPFAVPNHPLIEARLEAIARRGGSSFLEYTLPEAVLKFRQGAGRLIRSSLDTGTVTVLDSRILRKPYGKIFLAALPACPIEVLTAEGEVEFFPSQDFDV